MKKAAIIICWICVISAGAFLRFDDLGKRPFHADEATGARITAKRMEPGGATFDPKHFHGPLLADLAEPICKLRGENHWPEMTKTTLRILPAIAGTLLVCLPLLWRRRFGDPAMLLSAALLATSPLLVYYSRMFIHEILLALLGLLAVMVLTRNPRWGAAGFLTGLMFATKESFAISIIAWTAAGFWIALENRQSLNKETLTLAWSKYRMPVAVSLLTAAVTAILLYTDFLRHPQGAIDAVRTFFIYETVGGHEKSASYYVQLLAFPKKSGGIWWFETPVLLLALAAYASTFNRKEDAIRSRVVIRFLAYSAAAHFLIYSIISYKTPWLACLPWAHVCLLAGFAITGWWHTGTTARVILTIIAMACATTQFKQSRMATGRYASDVRNPYAYVPTQRDVETLEPWLRKLGDITPGGTVEPISVVGTDYWPLPWYLRTFEQTGYWPELPDKLAFMPLVFSSTNTSEKVMHELEKTHTLLPRGLRAEVPLLMFVRNDIWNRWMEAGEK
ncbi:MAG: flippase activity-associated protein Agl23 [Verrucomicrobiota bacterium]